MTIIPPGSWKTVFPAGELFDGDGDVDADGDVEGEVDGDDDPDVELPGLGDVLEDGDVLAGGVLDGGALAGGGGGRWLGRELVGVAVVAAGGAGAVVFWVAVSLGWETALAEAALADAADAADADCSLACAEAPACEITLGVEPATSCPTRLTAVRVTAVTNAHDIAQPSANASGRPVQPRSARAKDRRSWRGSEFSGTRLVSAPRRRQ
jgi:hypothetical protein